MKKSLLLLSCALFPYLFALAIIWALYTPAGLAAMDAYFQNNIYLLIGYLLLFWVVCFVLSLTYFLTVLMGKSSARQTVTVAMILKVIHIPFFITFFIIGAILMLFPVFGMLLSLMIFFVDVLTILLSGIAGAGAAIRCAAQKCISKRAAVLYAISQFIFCADIICIILLFVKIIKHSPSEERIQP